MLTLDTIVVALIVAFALGFIARRVWRTIAKARAKNAAAVFAILAGLARQGRTVVAVTHDEGLAQTAQRRVHLVDGRVVRDGPVG